MPQVPSQTEPAYVAHTIISTQATVLVLLALKLAIHVMARQIITAFHAIKLIGGFWTIQLVSATITPQKQELKAANLTAVQQGPRKLI
jgi:hypothetical protein